MRFSKYALALAIALILCPSARAQTSRSGRVLTGTGAPPSSCTVGDKYFRTATTVLEYDCLATNTWTALAAVPVADSNLSGVISSAITYYVAPATMTTCSYNGGTGVSCTPSDSNACTTTALPCATLAGAQALIANKQLKAVVTIQLADNAGGISSPTGTCYQPNDLVFDNPIEGRHPSQFFAVGGGAPDSFPTAYVYVLGNPTTPTNVNMTGATTCAGTTNSVDYGLVFDNTNVRLNGLSGNYFGGLTQNIPNAGPFRITGGTQAFAENISCTFDGTKGGACLNASGHSTLSLGGTQSTTNGQFVNVIGSLLESTDPSNTSTTNTNLTFSSSMTLAAFQAQEAGSMMLDKLTASFAGTGAYSIFDANQNARIEFNDAFAAASCASSKCFDITLNAANATYSQSDNFSFIDAPCQSVGSARCTITTTPNRRANAANDAVIIAAAEAAGTSGDLTATGSCVQYSGSNTCAVEIQDVLTALNVGSSGQFAINSNGGITKINNAAASGGWGVPEVLASNSTQSTGSISATTLFNLAGAAPRTLIEFSVAQINVGVGCSTASTVQVNLIWTDTSAGGTQPYTMIVPLDSSGGTALSTTASLTSGTITVANYFFSSAILIRPSAGTNVQYSTTFTAGTGCTTNPTYEIRFNATVD